MNELEFNQINVEKLSNLLCGTGSLVYSKTFEEEMDEKKNVSLAESYLRSLGIVVKTDYGYYQNTYDILNDLGDYLSENNTNKV